MATRFGLGEGRSPELRRIAVPASIPVLGLATATTCYHLIGRSPQVIAVAAAALLAAAAGVGWVIFRESGSDVQDLIALVAAGVAGAVLSSLLPGTPFLVYLAMAGLGLRLPAVRALTAGVLVFAAQNLAFLLSPQLSPSMLAGQDLGTVFFFAIGVFARSAKVSRDVSRAAQARAEDLLAQLRASQAALTEAAALTERTRLAREIHDILAHTLSGLVLALDTMQLLGQQADPASRVPAALLEQVARAQRIARDGLADTRRAIAALRGDELPGPVLLDRLVRETAAATGIAAALTVTGEQRPLPPEIGLALYRTAQETLINTAKYAGSGGRAELRLSYGQNDVELVVQDTPADGARPARPGGLTFGGYGLTGMRERAELLGGSLTAGPAEEGFLVQLRLPVVAAAS